MKKKIILVILLLLCAVFTFVGCTPPDLGNMKLQRIEGEANVHTKQQTEYLASHYSTVENYANGTRELSFPNAVTLKWTSSANDRKDIKYTVEISRQRNFANSMQIVTYNPFVDVYNLLLGTQYYWRVIAEVGGSRVVSKAVETFKTTDVAPRNIFVDGITNVRDLGGWKTTDGKVVKQGLLYRSGRLNTSWYTDVNADVTSHGIKTMRETLKIKSEIDLRKDYENEVSLIRESVLGSDVNYYACAMEFDNNVLGTNSIEGNKEGIKQVFSLLADANNYPMFFHCDIGTDRTGLIAFLVNGLLGVDINQLYRDYLFSNFARIGASRNVDGIKSAYVNFINGYSGQTLSEKIKNVLINVVGVTNDEIETIRSILL